MADLLVRDLLDSVHTDPAGRCFWDRGDPHLNTALGTCALLAAGYDGPVATQAVDYLLSQQDPGSGAWHPGVFFRGRLDSGLEATWVSAPLTTALALEALCRHRLPAVDLPSSQRCCPGAG